MSSLDMLSGAIALSLDIALFDMVLFDMVSGLPMSSALATELPSRKARDRQAAEAAETAIVLRSEEHTSELQSLMRISYAVFCLKKQTNMIYSKNPRY